MEVPKNNPLFQLLSRETNVTIEERQAQLSQDDAAEILNLFDGIVREMIDSHKESCPRTIAKMKLYLTEFLLIAAADPDGTKSAAVVLHMSRDITIANDVMDNCTYMLEIVKMMVELAQ